MPVPEIRIRRIGAAHVNPERDFVLYWMTAFRRARSNFALQRAVEWCRELGRPLLVFEPLRCDYRWASDRHHRFVIEGMLENARTFDGERVAYYPYLEPESDAGTGMLEALAERACVVVGDDYPSFFLPRMLDAAAAKLPVALEVVDGNGLLPIRAPDRVFTAAFHLRRWLQKNLPDHLEERPFANPLNGDTEKSGGDGAAGRLGRLVSTGVRERWPTAFDLDHPACPSLDEFPIDHGVPPVGGITGGHRAAALRLSRFLEHDLERYDEARNRPQEEVTSRLSPWLHFGHIGAHEVFEALGDRENWSPQDLSDSTSGKREGWWGMSPEAESFLDELVTWRELGFNMASRRADHHDYESLPDWAQQTLAAHAADERPAIYDVEAFERAQTHEPLWNAAQGQLLTEGRIHNYMRMLWGKKILHWSASPPEALEIMIELNNKYALDGRDPNSYSGIFWCLGRYDRAWGPEREVFGKVRYMTCASARRKFRVDDYVDRYTKGAERLF